MSIPAPFISRPMPIVKDWVDINGNLKNAYYSVVFDRCSDGAFELLGIGLDYVQQRNQSNYTAENHVCYLRPLRLDDQVTVSFQILDHDEKRIRSYQEMHHVDGWLAATSETLSLHVDLSGPKVSPFPADIRTKVEAMTAAHAALPLPERAGRHIDIFTTIEQPNQEKHADPA